MLKLPDSMEECVYFTKRAAGNGKATCWVLKQLCVKCKKAMMSKPKDEKTGGVKIRAKEYVCPVCKYTAEKQAYEDTLTANIIYVCPKCGNNSEIQIPFKRKKVEGIDALVFNCQKCNERILITKKMKQKREKGGDGEDE